MPDKPTAPLTDRARCHMQAERDHLAVSPVGTSQNDARTARDARQRSRAVRQRVQSVSFLIGQDQRNLGASRFSFSSLPRSATIDFAFLLVVLT